MDKYELTDRAAQMIDDLFTFHPVHGDQAERYSAIRDELRLAAVLICKNTPPSAEQTLALRALHMAGMHANSAIACNEKPDDSDLRTA